ncbi:MAG: isocitrate/isopropylmalate family dehydrogenase, partial [Erysipelotrichaceae bacterium]
GLIGGLGLLPSSNIGNEYAMFEAVHGSAPDIAGKHIANPTALLLSACMMLEYLHFDQEAKKIRDAIDTVLTQGQYKTQDLGGNATSEEYTNEIIKQLNK